MRSFFPVSGLLWMTVIVPAKDVTLAFEIRSIHNVHDSSVYSAGLT